MSAKAVPCSKDTRNGNPCKHLTRNINADCGRHNGAANSTEMQIAASLPDDIDFCFDSTDPEVDTPCSEHGHRWKYDEEELIDVCADCQIERPATSRDSESTCSEHGHCWVWDELQLQECKYCGLERVVESDKGDAVFCSAFGHHWKTVGAQREICGDCKAERYTVEANDHDAEDEEADHLCRDYAEQWIDSNINGTIQTSGYDCGLCGAPIDEDAYYR